MSRRVTLETAALLGLTVRILLPTGWYLEITFLHTEAGVTPVFNRDGDRVRVDSVLWDSITNGLARERLCIELVEDDPCR